MSRRNTLPLKDLCRQRYSILASSLVAEVEQLQMMIRGLSLAGHRWPSLLPPLHRPPQPGRFVLAASKPESATRGLARPVRASSRYVVLVPATLRASSSDRKHGERACIYKYNSPTFILLLLRCGLYHPLVTRIHTRVPSICFSHARTSLC